MQGNPHAVRHVHLFLARVGRARGHRFGVRLSVLRWRIALEFLGSPTQTAAVRNARGHGARDAVFSNDRIMMSGAEGLFCIIRLASLIWRLDEVRIRWHRTCGHHGCCIKRGAEALPIVFRFLSADISGTWVAQTASHEPGNGNARQASAANRRQRQRRFVSPKFTLNTKFIQGPCVRACVSKQLSVCLFYSCARV
jgi:hypothetical protein